MNFSKDERRMLIDLICDKQTRMIVKDHTKYKSKEYKELEKLKVRIKDMWGGVYMTVSIGALVVGGILIFIGGMGAGIVLISLCAANGRDRDEWRLD